MLRGRSNHGDRMSASLQSAAGKGRGIDAGVMEGGCHSSSSSHILIHIFLHTSGGKGVSASLFAYKRSSHSFMG